MKKWRLQETDQLDGDHTTNLWGAWEPTPDHLAVDHSVHTAPSPTPSNHRHSHPRPWSALKYLSSFCNRKENDNNRFTVVCRISFFEKISAYVLFNHHIDWTSAAFRTFFFFHKTWSAESLTHLGHSQPPSKPLQLAPFAPGFNSKSHSWVSVLTASSYLALSLWSFPRERNNLIKTKIFF